MKPTDHYDDGVPKVEAEYLHTPGVAHEHDDVNVRGLVAFVSGLAAITVGVMVLMWALFMGFERLAAGRDPNLSPLVAPASQRPPEPRLLTNEPEYLRQVREREARALAGGTDEATGAARMSIEEAMRQIAAQGQATAGGEADDPRRGTRAASMGEASGGRVTKNKE